MNLLAKIDISGIITEFIDKNFKVLPFWLQILSIVIILLAFLTLLISLAYYNYKIFLVVFITLLLLSLGIFIYLKFFNKTKLINITYLKTIVEGLS